LISDRPSRPPPPPPRLGATPAAQACALAAQGRAGLRPGRVPWPATAPLGARATCARCCAPPRAARVLHCAPPRATSCAPLSSLAVGEREREGSGAVERERKMGKVLISPP